MLGSEFKRVVWGGGGGGGGGANNLGSSRENIFNR